MGSEDKAPETSGLHRHFGLLHATALNVSMIVGAGVFATIPLMLGKLPGPYALLGWIGAGLLIILDGLIWSELGAMMPGSGGTFCSPGHWRVRHLSLVSPHYDTGQAHDFGLARCAWAERLDPRRGFFALRQQDRF